MIKKWLHINEIGGDPWIRPIWRAVIEATKAGEVDPLPKNVSELGLHISTRLDILPRVIARLYAEVNMLFTACEKHKPEHEFTKGGNGYAFFIDDTLKYKLLADIDSLMFELNSVCELMSNFFDELYSRVGKPIKKGKVGLEIKKVIKSSGQDAGWFQDLDRHRNFFIHKGAPYIAIDISRGSENYDLIIMKENLKKFDDPSKFVRFSELDQIVRSFARAKPIIQENLIKLFIKNP